MYHGINFEPEFEFLTSRSSGPGGQNVNKTESRVELRFNVVQSQLLTDFQKEQILHKIPNKISSTGILIITSQESRSQLDNKMLCIQKFYEILEYALMPEVVRKKPKVPFAIKMKRLENKRHNAEKKQNRRKDFL